MKQVVMLANSGHQAFDTRIFQKEAKSLVAAGFEVALVVPHSEDQTVEGIRIHAVPRYEKGWQKLVKSPWLIYKKALKLNKKAVFVLHDSELLWIGILLWLGGRTMVYDAHEDTPLQISYQHWIPSAVRPLYAGFYRLLEFLAGKMFSHIIVAEPIIARYFPSHKTSLIRNFPIVDQNHTPRAYASRKKQLVYVGLISEARGFSIMLRAVKLAQIQVDFEFVLGGKFAPESLAQALSNEESKIRYIGWVPYAQLYQVLEESQVSIIIPQPTPRYLTNYPVKLFEYMTAGMPVIASKLGEAGAFVQNAGMLVDPLSVEEVSQAIIRLFSNPELSEAMGSAGRKLALEQYNWQTESKGLIKLFQQL